jgi:hypothetical protein
VPLLNYDVFALADIAGDDYPELRVRVHERLREFECERSEHLQAFARNTVARWERHGHSRTYVLINPVGDGDIDVAGFFTVGMTALDYSSASSTLRKKLSGDVTSERTGAYSIAELARADRYSGEDLPGSIILDEAKRVIREARKYVAGRFAVVDCQPKVFESLYQPAGFRQIDVAEPPLGMEEHNFITACCVVKDW